MSGVLWQRGEGALIFLAATTFVVIAAIYDPTIPWWALIVLFFAPDLGFLGYLAGPRVGAAVYNLLHLYGAGLVLLVWSAFFGPEALTSLAMLWMAHIGFDRMLGYGLKEPTAFADTHLGRIGRR